MSIIQDEHKAFHAGVRAPLCCGMSLDRSFYSFEGQSGRPAAIILAGALSFTRLEPLVRVFDDRAGDFTAIGADVIVLVDGESEHIGGYQAFRPNGLKIIFCLSQYFEHCGFDDARPWILTLDRNQRVITIIDFEKVPDPAEAALIAIDALPIEEPRDIALPAPVLMIPRVLSNVVCRRLIDHFESSPPMPGGIAGIDQAGNPFLKFDHDKKRREDCVIVPEDPVHGDILDALTRICLPEIKRVFQFDAHYLDRILIARYDETGGYFRRHRDNVAPSVAFRQFAVSINLNTGDYEGGYLAFPEYNDHRYRPGQGAGIVFSASLLHEATPVTKGRRYVLLTFFHNAEAQARRAAALQ